MDERSLAVTRRSLHGVAELILAGSRHSGAVCVVGPWTPRTGDFWNATFGATRLMTELSETAALTNFFKTGRSLAALPAN